jgi:hypothetical protein
MLTAIIDSSWPHGPLTPQSSSQDPDSDEGEGLSYEEVVPPTLPNPRNEDEASVTPTERCALLRAW